MSYVDVFAMFDNATYKKQVTVACRVAAYDVLSEAPATANHTNRIAWATAILRFNADSTDRTNRMIGASTANTTLQQTAPAGPWSDSDIQFVVNSLVDIQANILT